MLVWTGSAGYNGDLTYVCVMLIRICQTHVIRKFLLEMQIIDIVIYTAINMITNSTFDLIAF